MSLDLTLDLKSLEQPLQESIRELRRGYQSIAESLEQTLAESELRALELSDCKNELADARRSLSESEKQRGERTRVEVDLLNRCAAFKKHVEAQQAELAQAGEGLSHARAELTQVRQRLDIEAEQNQRLQETIARLETDREATRQELSQLRSQLSRLAESSAEATSLRTELGTAQAELTRLRSQSPSVPDDAVPYEQLALAQAERQKLEEELDTLRHRTAELSQTLTDQRRIALEQREQWSEDLRQLRHAVERQSELLAERAIEEPSAAAADSSRKRKAEPAPSEAAADTPEPNETRERGKSRKSAGTTG